MIMGIRYGVDVWWLLEDGLAAGVPVVKLHKRRKEEGRGGLWE